MPYSAVQALANMTFRSLIHALPVSILCLGYSAQAEDIDPFKDWISTANHLRAQGVEPSSIGWLGIEQQCLGLKTTEDQRTYNACKYEKAMNGALHNVDKTQCLARARAVYPPSLAWQRPTDTVFRTGPHGTTQITYMAAPIPYRELLALRGATMTECMQNLGWASVSDANLGRRSY